MEVGKPSPKRASLALYSYLIRPPDLDLFALRTRYRDRYRVVVGSDVPKGYSVYRLEIGDWRSEGAAGVLPFPIQNLYLHTSKDREDWRIWIGDWRREDWKFYL